LHKKPIASEARCHKNEGAEEETGNRARGRNGAWRQGIPEISSHTFAVIH
jgi:hypothetical protein